jgi:hypothetical protein
MARLDRRPAWRAKQIASFDRQIARLDPFPASRAIDRSTLDRCPSWLAISLTYDEVFSTSDEICPPRDDVSLGRLAVRPRALDVRRWGFGVSFTCDEAFSVRDAVVVPRQDVPGGTRRKEIDRAASRSRPPTRRWPTVSREPTTLMERETIRRGCFNSRLGGGHS